VSTEIKILLLSCLKQTPEVVARIAHIDEIKFQTDQNLIFTIAGLHQLYSQTYSQEQPCTYAEFRTQLYNGTLNQELAEHGLKVDIHHSTQKVDTSWYRLGTLD